MNKNTFPRAVPSSAPKREADRIQPLAEEWGSKYAQRVQETRGELREAAPGAGPDELLLRDFAAVSSVEVEILMQLELALAEKALELAMHPKPCSAVAKVLLDVARVGNAVGRRTREALHAAAVLKAQRLIGSGGSNGV